MRIIFMSFEVKRQSVPGLVLAVAAAMGSGWSARAATISGMTISQCNYSAANVCNAVGPLLADTIGGNSAANLYFINPQSDDPNSGPINWTPNSGNGANVPVSYIFDYTDVGGLFMGGGVTFESTIDFQPTAPLATFTNYAINVFLNGNTVAPSISYVVEARDSVINDLGPNSGNTYALTGALTAGAGTEAFTESGWTWLLVSGGIGFPGDPGSIDRVGAFDNVADGQKDYSFSFRSTLVAGPSAAPVPEPSTLLMLIAGFGARRSVAAQEMTPRARRVRELAPVAGNWCSRCFPSDSPVPMIYQFYLHHEFIPLADHPKKLFLPMATIQKILS